ncbi:complex I subunit 4 family protein [Desulfovibrio ferrophilus]|uniref:Proton-translocating NADH-quinone oxidoreductase subunit M n=1 Tax=Desulfovibrio ferrophilus TaxID=241368 RepID=A0A2Z6AUG6_9BACT|nr:NADH-quinone oxidoreductase subunit M [Desulfovibrio ferrophilus]BBD06874.1 proton-translocating NADH-quinone oxidoreductase subunit M [Desulfovibrio ferrophilus]
MIDAGYPVLTTLIFFPLAATLPLLLYKTEKMIRWYTLVIGFCEMLLAAPLLGFELGTAKMQFVEKVPWVPEWNLNYYLGLDGISLFMILLTVILLPLCTMCSWTYISKRIKEFHICLMLMTSACVGVFVAMDFVLFYIFWEAMLVPMYLLIAVWGGPERRYASIKFFLYTLAGSTLLLVAIIALYYQTGTFSIPELMHRGYGFEFQCWVFGAMALAFAIKVPMFPFHTWLPAAHVQAPSAGSVYLASILLKMGTYGFLRFCLPITPLASQYFAPLMIAVSLAGIIYGGLTALGQSDIKKLIAYSSVSHMGFVTLGIFLFNLRGVEGAIMQMLNHGIVTGALFMLVGAVYERSHSREMADNMGLGKYLPAYMGFFGLFALASFGFPGTNSFVGEALVLFGAFAFDPWIGAISIPGAMIAAAYMLRLGLKMAWGQPASPEGGHGHWYDLTPREWAYLTPLAILVFYIGLAPGLCMKVIDPSLEKLLGDFRTDVVQVQMEDKSLADYAPELPVAVAEN